MNSPQVAEKLQAYYKKSLNRRKFQRVPVNLLGRFMLTNQAEYPCHIFEMSPGDAGLVSPIKGVIGEQVVVYVEQLGRIEGVIARHTESGFAITLNASARKRDKLADQLTYFANRHLFTSADDRRHDRVVTEDLTSRAVLPDGEIIGCRVLDMSLSGAAIDIGRQLPIGSMVTLGNVRGRVVRPLGDGIAIEFIPTQLNTDSLHAQIA